MVSRWVLGFLLLLSLLMPSKSSINTLIEVLDEYTNRWPSSKLTGSRQDFEMSEWLQQRMLKMHNGTVSMPGYAIGPLFVPLSCNVEFARETMTSERPLFATQYNPHHAKITPVSSCGVTKLNSSGPTLPRKATNSPMITLPYSHRAQKQSS